jgi:hypothetical protein
VDWASAFLLTTWVNRLDRGYLLIGARNGGTAMPLFAYEIEFRRSEWQSRQGDVLRLRRHHVSL